MNPPIGDSMKKTIIGLQLQDRDKISKDLQSVLTKHGCVIKTRIGLHDIHENTCAPEGTILLDLHGSSEKISELEKGLSKIGGITIKKMEFD